MVYKEGTRVKTMCRAKHLYIVGTVSIIDTMVHNGHHLAFYNTALVGSTLNNIFSYRAVTVNDKP